MPERDPVRPIVAAALKAKPGSTEALTNYGVILDALKRHVEALATFDRALALQTDNATSLCNRLATSAALEERSSRDFKLIRKRPLLSVVLVPSIPT